MKNFLKKKRFLFPFIFIIQIVLFVLIANIFNLETGNSIVGMIYYFMMVVAVLWFLLRIIKDHKTKLSETKLPLFGVFGITALIGIRFVIALSIFGAVLVMLMFFINW